MEWRFILGGKKNKSIRKLPGFALLSFWKGMYESKDVKRCRGSGWGNWDGIVFIFNYMKGRVMDSILRGFHWPYFKKGGTAADASNRNFGSISAFALWHRKTKETLAWTAGRKTPGNVQTPSLATKQHISSLWCLQHACFSSSGVKNAIRRLQQLIGFKIDDRRKTSYKRFNASEFVFESMGIFCSLRRPDRLWCPPSLLSNGYWVVLLYR
jgi:hypothetical protein